MSDVFDYLNWRGDLRFDHDAFNEIDNLIFSCMAYIDFEDIVPSGTCSHGITLSQAAQKLKAANRPAVSGFLMPRYPALFEQAAQTVRYRDVFLTCYVNEVDETKPNQFSAIVFSISSREHYVSFRGTDDNVAGWKEDFLMSFKDVVLAQTQAAAYLKNIMTQLKGRFYVGGHSKGGNLAVFSSAHMSEKNKKKIAAVYNNDGPGFHSSIINSEGYKSIVNRIHTFIPKSSIVGMLLEHGEAYKILASTEKGLLSHNPLTWSVSGRSFIREKELSKSSRQINDALRACLDNMTLQQREQFVEALFDVISASGAHTFSELSTEWLTAIDATIRKLKSMDKETRKILRDTVIGFFTIRQRLFRESLGLSVEALLAKKV